jgi:hypothetical protein
MTRGSRLASRNDPQRGYFTTGSELARSLTALSLGGLRRRIEALMLPDDVNGRLNLDRAARLERDRRRRGGAGRSSDLAWPP